MSRNVSIILIVGVVLSLVFGCQPEEEKGIATEQVVAVEKVPVAKVDVMPAPPKVKATKARITFESTTLDFGKIGPGTRHEGEFKFKNTGTDVLHISNINSPCGCTITKLKKTTYAPGESGVIEVTFTDKVRMPGKQAKEIYVRSNDSENPRVELHVMAEVELKIVVEPAKLIVFLNKKTGGAPKITLKSKDGKEFAVRGVQAPTGMKIPYDSAESATEIVLQPEIDPEKLRDGAQGRIEIIVNHPECSKVGILYETLGEFKVTPPSVFLLKAEPGKPMIKDNVWVINNYGEDFEIGTLSSKSGYIKVISKEKIPKTKEQGARYKLKLEVTPPDRTSRARFFTDYLYIGIKGGKKITIKCNGYYLLDKKTR